MNKAMVTIQNCEITENAYAGLYANLSSPILGCNNIYNNSDFGIYNASPGTNLMAINQWWGSSMGPYHPVSNPNGTGNAVSDGIEYAPWANQPCFAPQAITTPIFLPMVRNR